MKRFILTAAAVALLGCVTPVQASPITYTETATATGTLGLLTFTDALVTMTLMGDTSTVTHFGQFFQNFGSGPVTVNVSGLGTAIFNTTVVAFDDQNNSIAGLQDFTSGLAILDTLNAAFGPYGYDLKSPIGPVSGGIAAYNPDQTFPTSLGNFQLTSTSGNSTFSATESPTPTPEPVSLMLIGTAVVGLVGRRFRRRTAQSH
jgi:hypothetical protein